ncbi:DUF4232 domain-containing protein, partial [Streptomyces albidoflavus]
MTPHTRRLLLSSLAAGVLWLVFAAVRWAFLQIPGGASRVGALVPDVVPLTTWMGPDAWPVVAVVLGAVAVAACFALYAVLVRGGVRATPPDAASVLAAEPRAAASGVAGTWFAAVAAGATVGLAMDAGHAWAAVVDYGARGLLIGDFGATAAAGALWGLAAGWVPALLLSRSPRETGEPSARTPWLAGAAAASVVAVLAMGVAGDAARTKAIAAEAEAARAVEAQTSFGAPADPDAAGDPVPTTAPGSGALDPRWCTADRAMLLKGEPDAATGHRALAITLMNFSEAPCVIEGYPDIAFGDQNDHELAVVVERGSSFMAQDAG